MFKLGYFYGQNYHRFQRRAKDLTAKTSELVRKKPLTSFFIILFVLFGLIVAGSFFSPKKEDAQKGEVAKEIQIYQIGQTPKVRLQATIEKSGVIKINALAPGVISKINFKQGDQVRKGSVLLSMASNYQGGNVASVARQIAQKQFNSTKDSFESQKDLLRIQRDIAQKSDENSSQLRDITNQSIGETQDLINLNQSILDTLNQNQTTLEQDNPGGVNDTAILQLKSQRAQVQGGLNQLNSALRLAKFQSAGDKPPAQLATLQKDATLKQLDIQEKALSLGLEISRLQLSLAQISEALYFPASPFDAKVQRVHVKEGQSVNPGTVLVTLSATEDPITAIVNLPRNLAGAVSVVALSTILFDDTALDLAPNFVSTEATDGTLYSVFYIIPDEFTKDLTEGGNVTVEMPIGVGQSNSAIPFIPLDAVYQSTGQSTVFVVSEDRAQSREVILGSVFGSFVEVKNGLLPGDKVIVNRNVLAGDKVAF